MMPFVEDRDDEYGEEEEDREQEESSKKSELEAINTEDDQELGSLGKSHIIPPTTFSFPSTGYHQILDPPGDVRDVPGRSSTAAAAVQTEHMFDKVVTPSDVGKLNRLVIPKQHAEKYFPLDSSANEKGLLLSFEDRSGKQWRFRYSYWNSSQSYVMTKGWSRFVKDKKLDAGDIVTFERGLGEDHDRLFIDWKRRPSHHPPHRGLPVLPQHRQAPWGRVFFPTMATHLHHVHPQLNYGYGSAMLTPPSPQYNFRIPAGAMASSSGSSRMPMVIESMPVAAQTTTVTSSAPGKRFRLFGVNLDCAEQEPNDLQRRRQPELELDLYHGGETTPSSSSAREVKKKEKQSSLSLDLDI